MPSEKAQATAERVYREMWVDNGTHSETAVIEHIAEAIDAHTAELRATIAEQAADKDSYVALLVEARGEVERLRKARQTWRSRMGLKVESDIVRENERLRKDS